MRQKAERKIRDAAAALGQSNRYRIDRVRAKTDLVRKVFEKTLLDMARLETIELRDGDIENLDGVEPHNLMHHQERRYVYFSFIDGTVDTTSEPALPSQPPLSGIESEMWRKFEYLCEKQEGKNSTQKLCELIQEYIREAN